MKAHGFSIDDIEKWGGSYVLGNSQIGLDAITDGKADVFMNARNLGDSLVKDIAGKRALLWIDGDRATIQKAADAFNFKADMVPKGTYPFMEKDYPTVRMWVSLLAGSHVPDEVVYKYVKAIAENEARVQDDRRLAQDLVHDAEDGDQPGEPAVPPGRAALLQGKGAGEVARCGFLNWEGSAAPPGRRLGGPDPGRLGRRRALRAVDRRARADHRQRRAVARAVRAAGFARGASPPGRAPSPPTGTSTSRSSSRSPSRSRSSPPPRARGASASPGPTSRSPRCRSRSALYYIVLNDKFLNWSRGFSQPTTADIVGRPRAGRAGGRAVPAHAPAGG